MHHIRCCFMSIAVACLCLPTVTPSHAAMDDQTGTCELDLVPLVLTATPESAGYILPTCGKCKRLTLARQTAAAGDTWGALRLVYHDDDAAEFMGRIELTVVLSDDTEHRTTIEDVWLVEGEEAEWVIEASDPWTWNQASMVWLTFVHA